MDREQFDAVARLLGAKPSRRAMAGTLLSALLFGQSGAAVAKPGRGKHRSGRRGRPGKDHRQRIGAEQIPATCCSGSVCAPGPGKNLQKCCYEGQTLSGKNFKGANLDRATFAGAILANANFSGANLDKTCFVDATLTGAKFTGANTGTAIFCRTTMPDGSENNSGCSRGTSCCPTCTAEGDPCDLDISPCCSGAECIAGVCSTCRDDNAFACGFDGDACGPACAANQPCVDGTCVSCAEACSVGGCTQCARLVDGSTTCAGTVSVGCDVICAATADCPVFESCVLTITNAGGTVLDVAGGCGAPADRGVCLNLSNC